MNINLSSFVSPSLLGGRLRSIQTGIVRVAAAKKTVTILILWHWNDCPSKTVTTWHIGAIKVGGEACPSHDLYLKISSHGDRLLITAPTAMLTWLFFSWITKLTNLSVFPRARYDGLSKLNPPAGFSLGFSRRSLLQKPLVVITTVSSRLYSRERSCVGSCHLPVIALPPPRHGLAVQSRTCPKSLLPPLAQKIFRKNLSLTKYPLLWAPHRPFSLLISIYLKYDIKSRPFTKNTHNWTSPSTKQLQQKLGLMQRPPTQGQAEFSSAQKSHKLDLYSESVLVGNQTFSGHVYRRKPTPP